MNSHQWHSHILRSVTLVLCIILFAKTNRLLAEENNAQNLISDQYDSEIQVLSVAWNPNGSQIALGTTRGVALYDVKDSKISGFKPLDRPISPIAWGPNGTELAGVSQTHHTIFIWDIHGKLIGNLVDTPRYIWSMAWSPQSNLLATGEPRKATIWNANAFQKIKDIPTDDRDVMGVAWNPDGRRLALTFNIGGNAEVWDTVAGKKVVDIGSDRAIEVLAWNPDGTKMVTGGQDSPDVMTDCPTCVTWNPQIWSSDGTLWSELHGHSDLIIVTKWSPDGKYILTGSRDGEFIVWDAIGGYRVDTFTLFPNSFNPLVTNNSIDWSPDGRYLAFATDTGHLGIRDVITYKMVIDLDLETI
jgi:WD40 repeat protein